MRGLLEMPTHLKSISIQRCWWICQAGEEVCSLWSFSFPTSCSLKSGSTSSRMAIDNFITRFAQCLKSGKGIWFYLKAVHPTGEYEEGWIIMFSWSCPSTMMRRMRADVLCLSGSRAGAERRLEDVRSLSLSHPFFLTFTFSLFFRARRRQVTFTFSLFFLSCNLPFSLFFFTISSLFLIFLILSWTSTPLFKKKILHFQVEISSQVISDFESLFEFCRRTVNFYMYLCLVWCLWMLLFSFYAASSSQKDEQCSVGRVVD